MSKTYAEFMDEITADELYKGLLAHGLFSEKLPPVFTATDFFQYTFTPHQPFSKTDHGFVFFDSMRDINIPRSLGIPNPMAYQRLCECLKENWQLIRDHLRDQTAADKHKISRIHIRKQKDTEMLFKMNYKNWKTDDSPVPDILIGKRYMVCADISTCFPSMYTHSLCWALVGKDQAKKNREESLWYNALDHRCMEVKSGETHGFLIGPHASNLLSEIILTVVDKHLGNKWDYIRNIDDYTCYVSTYEEAQCFLTELAAQLRYFDLPLNHKKTKIEELPVASTKHWVRQLSAYDFSSSYEKVNYKKVQAYLDAAVTLMIENGNNAAILNYAVKVLARQKLTENAKRYCLKTLLHFAVIYPYIIPLLDEYVFEPFPASKDDIAQFANIIYDAALAVENYEAITYAIYFSIKYEFDIPKMDEKIAIQKDSCLFKCMAWMYYQKRSHKNAIKALKQHAKDLSVNDMDEYWLFIYEALPWEQLTDDWKPMKKAGISFIKADYREVKK